MSYRDEESQSEISAVSESEITSPFILVIANFLMPEAICPQTWEGEIGFAPAHVGENQKVEFFLYKDGSADPEETVRLWVGVKGS